QSPTFVMQKVLRHPAYWNSVKTLVPAPDFDRSSRSTKLHLFGRLPLAAPFLPFASRADILRKGGAVLVENLLLGSRLKTICLNELLQLGELEPKGAPHLHKRNPAEVHPAVEGGSRNSKKFGCVLKGEQPAFCECSHIELAPSFCVNSSPL